MGHYPSTALALVIFICLVSASLSYDFESKYEDVFHCKPEDGQNIPTNERILILSPDDHYFFKKANLENVAGKYVPKLSEKTFGNVLTITGILNEESGGTQF